MDLISELCEIQSITFIVFEPIKLTAKKKKKKKKEKFLKINNFLALNNARCK